MMISKIPPTTSELELSLNERVDRAQLKLPDYQTGGPTAAQPEGRSFGGLLAEALGKVNELQVAADQQAELVATGHAEHLHTAVMAMEKASLALQLTAQVTRRALEAYQEISRMQV